MTNNGYHKYIWNISMTINYVFIQINIFHFCILKMTKTKLCVSDKKSTVRDCIEATYMVVCIYVLDALLTEVYIYSILLLLLYNLSYNTFI